MNVQNYLFIDESGDPGRPYKATVDGSKTPTGASLFYILTAVYLNSSTLFALEEEIMNIRIKYGFRSEIKSTTIPLNMYEDILNIVNKLYVPIYYRLIDKRTYKGQFAIAGHVRLHNIFDDYNISKLVQFTASRQGLTNVEVVIDRADRRMYKNDRFASFDKYLFGKVNTNNSLRINHITHVSSEYVNAMQLSDLVSGALKEYFTGKNITLWQVINEKYLHKV